MKEKDLEMARIDGEIRKYDTNRMRNELSQDINAIGQGLERSQNGLLNDEKRHMRHLEKIELMQRAVVEDKENVVRSMADTTKLEKRAAENFEMNDKESAEERKKLEE